MAGGVAEASDREGDGATMKPSWIPDTPPDTQKALVSLWLNEQNSARLVLEAFKLGVAEGNRQSQPEIEGLRVLLSRETNERRRLQSSSSATSHP
jgi:hypothetical protein